VDPKCFSDLVPDSDAALTLISDPNSDTGSYPDSNSYPGSDPNSNPDPDLNSDPDCL
jgi:hypothetical protein